MVSKVRIEDVAEAAGVSMKTVSRVLNNEPNVRDAMRQRVGLARAGAGDDQQRTAIGTVEPVTGRGALLGVQACEEAVDA